MKTAIKKRQLKNDALGRKVWAYQVDGRAYGAGRPQFESKELALAALAKMIEDVRTGVVTPRAHTETTFGTIADEYFRWSAPQSEIADGRDEAAYKPLAGKTYRNYISCRRVHFKDLENASLSELTTPRLERFLKDARENGAAPATLRRVKIVLMVIFRRAVSKELLKVNPVVAIDIKDGTAGRRSALSTSRSERERVFTQDQILALLNYCVANDAEIGDFFFAMLRSGLRKGEARALKWGDISAAAIRVERNIDDQNKITRTKTGHERSVDLHPVLAVVLLARRIGRAFAGHDVGDDHFIFGNGVPVSDAQITTRFNRALAACGIADHSVYDARHSFASQLLAADANLVYVSRMLGHAKVTTTLEHYTHFIKGDGRRYIDAL